MSSRARYALIITTLALVLIGGGFAVWYFGFRTQVGTFLGVGSDSTDAAISWLDCGPNQTVTPYEFSAGDSFAMSYTCTNTDTVDHELEVEEHALDLYVWNEPGTGTCRDQSQVTGVWPPAFGEAQMLPVAANHTYGSAGDPCPVPAPFSSVQKDPSQSPVSTYTIPAGGSVDISVNHPLPNCNYYQWDDIARDPASPTSRDYLGFGVVRASGDAGAGQCPNAAEATGDVLVRIFEDIDKNGTYTEPPAGEGAVFAGQTYTIKDSAGQEIDYAACDNGDNAVGGAGRDTCRGLPAGTYSVDVAPDITTYDGPIQGPNNPNGDDPYTVTVSAGQTAIADFGYNARIIVGATGELLIRKYVDINRDDEYGANGGQDPAGEGAPFAFTDFSVFLAGTRTEIDYANCSNAQQFGGAGRANCELPPGAYDIDVADPDATVYAGPFAEAHNPNGDDPYQNVAVQQDQTTTADFGYDPLVQVGLTCSLVTDPDPARGQKPLVVNFDGSGSIPSQGSTITRYSWNFGEPSTGVIPSQPEISHTYQTAGTYTATLEVEDSSGATATCSAPVTVLEGPIVAGGDNTLRVVVFNDANENAVQDQGIAGPLEDGYNDVTVTVTDSSGAQIGQKDTVSETIIGSGTVIYGIANFLSLPDDTYTVTVDEGDRGELDGTGNTFLLSNMRRTVPTSIPVSVGLPTSTGETSATVEFGYNPRPVVQGLQCELDKTVTDETPADEGTPDDPGQTNSAPGEELTFSISWTCTGFAANFSFVLTDTYDNLLTVQPSSITGGGIHNQSTRTITWNVPNASGLQVASGTVSFKADIESVLAPGTYTLPNYVVMTGANGQVIAQDQTQTRVVVPPGTTVPDIEILKLCEDINGGTLRANDVIECDLVVWNNGNTPLTDVRVTDNMPPFVHGFAVVPPLPTGATDNSLPAPSGSNGTGFLDVSGFDLPNQGDVATITFRITVDAGVPAGTTISNLATAAAGTVSDTDTEDVTVGAVVSTPPTAPAAGPSSGPVPPPLGPRVFVPADEETVVPPEAGVSTQTWVLVLSALVAAAIATFVYSRLRLRPE